MFTVSQFGDLPLFFFLFILLARVGSSDLTEILASLPLFTFEYLVFFFASTFINIHLLTLMALLLQVAVFLKAAQWFFYP